VVIVAVAVMLLGSAAAPASSPASAATAPVSVEMPTAQRTLHKPRPEAHQQHKTRKQHEVRHLSITVAGWTRRIHRGGQRSIDRCRATLYSGPAPSARPRGRTSWLAGHDYCGFHRWDRKLRKGARFKVTLASGRVLRYRVTGKRYVARHGGSARGLIRGDLTLQTCRGRGTSFTYARLIR